jgi:hypothetical protein
MRPVRLTVVFADIPDTLNLRAAVAYRAASFWAGTTLFAFYKAYPQKRITAEIELIDKWNLQTYVESAVVRPLTIPSGAQSPPFLKPLGISFSSSCALLVNDALIRFITDAVR